MKAFFCKHKKLTILLAAIFLLFVIFVCIPVPNFDDPYSTVLTAKNGELLGAKIADDGQWRFPATNCYSDKYVSFECGSDGDRAQTVPAAVALLREQWAKA